MRALTALLAVSAVLALAGAALAQEEKELDVLNTLVGELHAAGLDAKSIPVAQRSLELTETRFGRESAQTATRAAWLGFIYEAQGEYTLAKPLFKQPLATYEKSLGHDHPDTAWSESGLAGLETRREDRAAGEAAHPSLWAAYGVTGR